MILLLLGALEKKAALEKAGQACDFAILLSEILTIGSCKGLCEQ
jgi:hypothetical protein